MKRVLVGKSEIKIEVANSFWTRLKGLLGTLSLAKDEALLIKPCNSVHMLGMCYTIDIIYLDKTYQVIKIVENLKPWIGFSMCWNAEYVLEMAAGSIRENNICLGQIVNVE